MDKCTVEDVTLQLYINIQMTITCIKAEPVLITEHYRVPYSPLDNFFILFHECAHTHTEDDWRYA